MGGGGEQKEHGSRIVALMCLESWDVKQGPFSFFVGVMELLTTALS